MIFLLVTRFSTFIFHPHKITIRETIKENNNLYVRTSAGIGGYEGQQKTPHTRIVGNKCKTF